eukprot:TRINITY_DN52229_c0_g1_i1.p1 TRINITY_DN52229_c0_g1~~TRINITY_DN52229_c0_g1_i1.p1  ORF type:complete len:165 (-),score=29.09 TRINITY_DN52229_c0_g1_i1:237-731(-)
MPLLHSLADRALVAALHGWFPTSFKDTSADDASFFLKEETEIDLSPTADVLPLCEDLNAGTVGNGDSCWSSCNGQCPNDVLKDGLAFDFDEVQQGHPGCVSHFECVGNRDRVLCHAVSAVEEESVPPWLVSAGFAVSPYLPRSSDALDFAGKTRLRRQIGHWFL